jgi:hypothetical protein
VRPPTLARSARRPLPLCASRAIAPDRYTERSAEIWLDWLKSGKAIGRPHLHRDPPRSQSQLLQEAACTYRCRTTTRTSRRTRARSTRPSGRHSTGLSIECQWIPLAEHSGLEYLCGVSATGCISVSTLPSTGGSPHEAVLCCAATCAVLQHVLRCKMCCVASCAALQRSGPGRTRSCAVGYAAPTRTVED